MTGHLDAVKVSALTSCCTVDSNASFMPHGTKNYCNLIKLC